jgi:hypothetical protein
VTRAGVAAAGLLLWAAALAAQDGLHVAAGATVLATRAAPMPFDRTLAEVRVVQPMLMASFRAPVFAVSAMLDLEGWTMPGGQLSPGSWGEGFNDRRHPHTYVHELMAEAVISLGRRSALSLAAGKGFAPFGSDDPMNRPAVQYPINHHWSQVLERAVVIAGIRRGPVTLEAGLFNGDEPARPSDWPLLARFGDSWSARVSLAPVREVELQLSRASIRSPEHRSPPAGPYHDKWSASARYERPSASGRRYAMAEWARTSELDGFFVYHSWLAEGEWRAGRHRPYLRLERTDRPEEERAFDPFRSQRPHFEDTNLGISRWRVVTAGYGVRLTDAHSRFTVEPLVEAAWAHVTMVTGGAVFTPQGHFGGNDLLTLNVGLRVGAGATHRVGRYGVLARPTTSALSHGHE